ncbi:hypothetical protein F4679DRAFT_585814 [Xylaria curta]|nr:hypothetical protein F4679DRAFT_585814 [Xylaria curta]
MATLQRTASPSSIMSIDSFIADLNRNILDNFVAWCHTLKMNNGKSLFDQRKELSHNTKKRPDNDEAHHEWTHEVEEDYNAYKIKVEKIATKKQEFKTAKLDLEDYRRNSDTNPVRLQSLLDMVLQKAEEWCNASVRGCEARLTFMAKFKNIFNKESTEGHIQQAEDNLRSARDARKMAQKYRRQLSQLLTGSNPAV